MTERFNGLLWCKQQSNVTDVLEKLCEVDKCVSQTDLRKRSARQALITDNVLGCIHSVLSVTFLSFHIHTHEYANYFHIFVSLRWVFVQLANMRSVVPHTCTWKMWLTSQVGYLKLLISRSILSGPLDFEIKRVACISIPVIDIVPTDLFKRPSPFCV